MSKMVNLEIDGFKVSVPEGTLIVNAAKQVGVDIPVFCYHPKMEPVGMCRMCLVEVGRPVIDRATGQPVYEPDGSPRLQFGPKLETACTTPVAEGMVVLGMTEKAKAGRKAIVEFLLTSHPLDCPVCDKGGECPLQNLTMGFGAGESRYLFAEKMHMEKHHPLGDLIMLDRERCIQCGRCVRFQDKIVDDPVIGFFQRGRNLEIVTFSEPGFDSYFSGNTTDICPVGALTTVDFRFRSRPWELRSSASICNHCPVGCNTTINTRREAAAGGRWAVKRIMPRQNEAVNEIWLCDKGRFGHHYAQSDERLETPLVRKNGQLVPASWEEALAVVAGHFRQAGSQLLTLAGGRLSNEDLFNLAGLTGSLGGQKVLYTTQAGGDLTAQVGLGPGSNFADLGPGTAIVVVACDLEEEAPLWWLRVKQAAERGALLIVANPRTTKLERYASHVLRYPYGSETALMLALAALAAPRRLQGSEAVKAMLSMPPVQAAARALAGAEQVVVLFGSEGMGLEASQALAQACAGLLLSTHHVGRENNGLVGVWQRANDQGAWDMGFRPVADLKSALQAARALYVIAADPAGDDPSLAEAGHFLVVQDLFLTATAKLADVVLPAQSFVEREGSYTSGERRVQRFYPATPAYKDCRADFSIAAQIGQSLGLSLQSVSAAQVMGQIAASFPAYAGVSYTSLAEVQPQWPVIGRSDLYYGGTSYENRQGLGVQLPLVAGAEEIPWPILPAWDFGTTELLAVPVTRLYDRGTTLVPSAPLQTRLPDPYIVLSQADAARLKVRAGDQAWVTLNDQPFLVVVQVNAELASHIVLVPRSLGLPMTGPAVIQVKRAQ